MLNNKGITPIIAIVLLLMITVAVAGTVSFWLSSVQSGAQSEIEESTDVITTTTQQALTISFKSCNESGDSVTVVVRNAGTKRIESGQAELVVKDEDGIEDLAYSTVDTFASLDVDENQEVVWNSFTPGSFDLVDEVKYQLVVTVPGGAKAEVICTAS